MFAQLPLLAGKIHLLETQFSNYFCRSTIYQSILTKNRQFLKIPYATACLPVVYLSAYLSVWITMAYMIIECCQVSLKYLFLFISADLTPSLFDVGFSFTKFMVLFVVLTLFQ